MINILFSPTGPIQANTYLVYDEKSLDGFLLDPGAYHSLFSDEIEKNGINLKYIILTHGHCDHIGGVKEFKAKYPSSRVVCHIDEKEMLENPRLNSSLEFLGEAISIEADIYVKDGDNLKLGDLDISFIHTPGHSKGGMCVKVENALFTGDTLFQGSIGRTDLYGGNMNQLLNSIRTKLYCLPDDTNVLPGHMGFTTIGDEKRSNFFVKA